MKTFIKEIPIDGSQVDADRSRLQELHVTNDDGNATPTIASPSDVPESVPERLSDSHADYIPPVNRESTFGKKCDRRTSTCGLSAVRSFTNCTSTPDDRRCCVQIAQSAHRRSRFAFFIGCKGFSWLDSIGIWSVFGTIRIR